MKCKSPVQGKHRALREQGFCFFSLFPGSPGLLCDLELFPFAPLINSAARRFLGDSPGEVGRKG